MKQYKVRRYIILAVCGLIIFTAGLAIIKLLPDADGILKTLPYICIGLQYPAVSQPSKSPKF